MNRALLLLSILLLLNGCIDHKVKSGPQQEEAPKVNPGFQKFLAEFPELSFPVEIKGCGKMPDLKILDGAISYPFYTAPEYIYGKFKFNDNLIAIITISEADCLLPILTTYSANGIKIGVKPLFIGQCSDGPCYKCEELLTIGKDLTIYVADTMQTFECDDDDFPKGAPVTTTVVYKEGKINPNGTIVLGDLQEKKL